MERNNLYGNFLGTIVGKDKDALGAISEYMKNRLDPVIGDYILYNASIPDKENPSIVEDFTARYIYTGEWMVADESSIIIDKEETNGSKEGR